MEHLPIWLSVKGRSVLVVGGTPAADAKARLALKAGAEVTVVAPAVCGDIAAKAAAGEVGLVRRGFARDDVDGRAVVYAATGVAEVDERVARTARARNVPVNVVDRPDHSTFVTPAIVDRDPVVVGISSGGAAPVLARRLRARIEALLPAGLGRLARFAGQFRGAVKATRGDPVTRRRFWEEFFDGPVAEAVLAGDEARARERMLTVVNDIRTPRRHEGAIHIVGAGPGDSDLLTLRAHRLLRSADVIVYDRLVGPEVLEHARRDAERIYVGKAIGGGGAAQDRINALMVAHARAGRRVVRLKGGDPYVFGRGAEEVDALRCAGIEAGVVPGITAATGCAASAGIPLTHRDHASAVTLVTGRGVNGEPDVNWAALAAARHTLVVYMGLSTAGSLARRLIAHGMDPTTPAAIVENGTLPSQTVVQGAVADLERMIVDHAVSGPALIVIGEVARRADARMPPVRAVAV